mgnify:CR=1 FL=1
MVDRRRSRTQKSRRTAGQKAGGKRLRRMKRTARKAVDRVRKSAKRLSRKAKRASKKVARRVKKTLRKGKKKLNKYMQALDKARKTGVDSFVYNGKTYYKKFTKTGMAIYSSKK